MKIKMKISKIFTCAKCGYSEEIEIEFDPAGIYEGICNETGKPVHGRLEFVTMEKEEVKPA